MSTATTPRAGAATEFATTCAAIAPRIDAAICALGATLRDIVVQHYLQGQTADAIAAQQRLGLAEVFSLLDLALHGIQSFLADEGVAARRQEIQAVLRGDHAERPPPSALLRRAAARVLRQTHPGSLRRVLGRIESLWKELAPGSATAG